MKILSWNVNGLRSGIKEYLEILIIQEDPDIICLQEIKCTQKQADDLLEDSLIYQLFPYRYWNESVKGFAGVCTLCKKKAEKVEKVIPGFIPSIRHSRFLCTFFKGMVLLNTYVPNTGRGREAEISRTIWHNALMDWLTNEIDLRNVNFIWTGDFNVSSDVILDTSHHTKHSKTIAGLKFFEKQQFDEYLSLGLVDVFRYFHPRIQKFTWVSSRQPNVKMRLDYFLVNRVKKVKNIVIGEYAGAKISDHCWEMLEI